MAIMLVLGGNTSRGCGVRDLLCNGGFVRPWGFPGGRWGWNWGEGCSTSLGRRSVEMIEKMIYHINEVLRSNSHLLNKNAVRR